MTSNPFSREQNIPFLDLIQMPIISESEASLRPMEKIFLAQFMMLVRPAVALELGVHKGFTTRFLAEFIAANHLDCSLHGFDLANVLADLRNSSPDIVELEKQNRLELVPGALPTSLESWLKTHPVVDFALVDAMHDFAHVFSELYLIWPHLSEGGIILCHDYAPGDHDGVICAINYFVSVTPGAECISLKSTAKADQFPWNGTDTYMYHSALAAVRRNPFNIVVPGNWTAA